MKDQCECCGVTPEEPKDDLVECRGCGVTICINDCCWDSEVDPERYWCFYCTDGKYEGGERMTWRELKEAVLAMDEKHLDEEVVVLTINHDRAENLKIEEIDGRPVLWEENT